MSNEEKQKVEELIRQAKQMPKSAEDYIRGYMQGVIDARK